MAVKSDDEVLVALARQALEVAQELRDPNDGPKKEEILRLACINLRSFLTVWGKSKSRPLEGSLHDTVFHIITDAQRQSGMPYASREKMAGFAKRAMRLRIAPGSWNRDIAVKFFQRIGEMAGAEREKSLPSREDAIH